MAREELAEAIADLKGTRDHLQSVRCEFQNEPDLLRFYEPSALEMVRLNEAIVANIMNEETGSEFHSLSEKESTDFWIRLEGDQFKEGKGPIGIVGSFLQKLSTSTQHVVEMLNNNFNGQIQVGSLFDLVQTAPGSLKLGLRRSIPIESSALLFPDDPWKRLKECSIEREKALQGINSLIEIISSINNNKSSENLTSDVGGEIQAYKLLHYAKEITPSSRSPISRVSFESTIFENVVADKNTRKAIIRFSKEIKQGIEYVNGNGIIRAVDIDNRTFIIRELIGKSFERNELECHFPSIISTQAIQKYLDQGVNITGFLHKTVSGRAQKIDIEKLSFVDPVEEE